MCLQHSWLTCSAQQASRAAVPTILSPGTGFVEDNFSTDRWRGVGGNGSGSNVSDGERQMKLCSLAAHLLLCGLFLAGCGPVGDPYSREQTRMMGLRSFTFGLALFDIQRFHFRSLVPQRSRDG